MVRRVAAILMLVLVCSVCLGAGDARRDQVAAATAEAVSRLHEQIARSPIASNLTVGDLLNQTNSSAVLDQTLQRSQLIGGPRWINEGVCQVRLEISGARVVQALAQIAATHGKASPVDAQTLQASLADWSQRSFSASGWSVAAGYVEQIRPRADAWQVVPEAARKQAVRAAVADGVERLLHNVSPVELTQGKTIGDALRLPAVDSAVRQWIVSRPLTNVHFRDDLAVTVVLSVSPSELTNILQAALSREKDFPQPSRAEWDRIGADVARLAGVASGIGHVMAGATAAVAPAVATTQSLISLPAQPPQWVGQQLQGEGIGKAGTSYLKAARAAEQVATAQIKKQIEALPLTDAMAISQAASANPAIAHAVDTALGRARTDRTEYREDGSVSVRMTLDLRELWQALSAAQP